MLRYARDDTHYLLYIYDRMRNDLIANGDPKVFNLMKVTLERSERTSLKVYHKDIYREDGSGKYGWLSIIHRDPKSLNSEQFAVLKAVHKWRDQTAREEDESPRYVMPNHILRRIAEEMPTDPQSVHGCCNPIPPLVRMYSMDIARIIEKTRNEFLKNKKENDKRFEETAKSLKAIKERAERGPIHQFFNDDNEEGNVIKMENIPMDIDNDNDNINNSSEDDNNNNKKKIPITIAEKSSFLINSDDEIEDEKDNKAYQLMLSIRKSLKLVSPSVTLLKFTEKEEENEDNNNRNRKLTSITPPPPKVENKKEEEEEKDDSKEIFTISETGKSKRKAESIEDLQKPAETQNSKKKHKKNKRSKKRSSSVPNTDNPNGEEGKEGKGNSEEGDNNNNKTFTPYDYENNKSDVIEMIKADANSKTVLETHKDKLKKLKNKKNNNNKIFKPFNALPNEVKFSEKIQKNTVNPRSGNRSYTFKNNKK